MLEILKPLLIGVTLLVFSIAHAKDSWQLSKSEDGIQVYVKDAEGSATQSFKGIVTISGRMTALIAVLDDIQAYPQLLHACKSASLLEEVSNTESYNYIITKMPWPIKNRDTVVHSVLQQDKQTKQVEIKLNAEPTKIESKPSLVRINKMVGRWLFTLTEKDSVIVEYDLNVDPGGNIPKWLVNTISVDIPFNTLKNLRSLSKKAVYQNSKLSYIID